MGFSISARLRLTWLALIAITFLAWWVGAHHDTDIPKPDAAVGLGAMAITVIKVRLILREFMAVRNAPARLRHITDTWLGLFIAAMLAAYFA